MPSAHLDTFAQQHLPSDDEQPDFLFTLPELQFPEQLNCATELLDRHVALDHGDRLCIQAPGLRWTYAELLSQANRIANVLVQDMGLVSGNRVLLRAPNNPMMAACWFAVMKAGGIAVATMPMLRAKELVPVITKADVTHALCDASLAAELTQAQAQCGGLQHVMFFNNGELECAMAKQPASFNNIKTAATDTCLIAFTSGTTGVPKGTMHVHRDVMAACACWPAHVLRPTKDDVFVGSPSLAFTFGLGGLLLFPMNVGASTVLIEKASPEHLVAAVQQFGATVLFTAPTSYRVMAAHGEALRRSPLRRCVSAGEALPTATRILWKRATGITLIDGIGTTELLHIFISADEHEARPGATGKVVPGYEAKVIDDDGLTVAAGTVGRLAVRGPTGCRYLSDERQRSYVKDGWNLTGDAYLMDADGYFFYQSRTDDMIVSSGYNIAAPEVEAALLLHLDVLECAVIGVPDAERGQIVKAFVVLQSGASAGAEKIRALQDFVKQTLAPYKYPRAIEFRTELPKTETGKLQRFKLKALS